MISSKHKVPYVYLFLILTVNTSQVSDEYKNTLSNIKCPLLPPDMHGKTETILYRLIILIDIQARIIIQKFIQMKRHKQTQL